MEEVLVKNNPPQAMKQRKRDVATTCNRQSRKNKCGDKDSTIANIQS
jgi:hypothetical protein